MSYVDVRLIMQRYCLHIAHRENCGVSCKSVDIAGACPAHDSLKSRRYDEQCATYKIGSQCATA